MARVKEKKKPKPRTSTSTSAGGANLKDLDPSALDIGGPRARAISAEMRGRKNVKQQILSDFLAMGFGSAFLKYCDRGPWTHSNVPTLAHGVALTLAKIIEDAHGAIEYQGGLVVKRDRDMALAGDLDPDPDAEDGPPFPEIGPMTPELQKLIASFNQAKMAVAEFVERIIHSPQGRAMKPNVEPLDLCEMNNGIWIDDVQCSLRSVERIDVPSTERSALSAVVMPSTPRTQELGAPNRYVATPSSQASALAPARVHPATLVDRAPAAKRSKSDGTTVARRLSGAASKRSALAKASTATANMAKRSSSTKSSKEKSGLVPHSESQCHQPKRTMKRRRSDTGPSAAGDDEFKDPRNTYAFGNNPSELPVYTGWKWLPDDEEEAEERRKKAEAEREAAIAAKEAAERKEMEERIARGLPIPQRMSFRARGLRAATPVELPVREGSTAKSTKSNRSAVGSRRAGGSLAGLVSALRQPGATLSPKKKARIQEEDKV